MIGELCSSGGGQRIRNSYGNIHGYHGNQRCHFGNNRAVSLDQYSSGGNNRRLSDGLPQVISDSNVFYGHRHNRSSLETTNTGGTVVGLPPHDTNANTNLQGSVQLKELLARTEADSEGEGEVAMEEKLPSDTTQMNAHVTQLVVVGTSSSNGNISAPIAVGEQILASNGSTRSSGSGVAPIPGGSPGGGGAPHGAASSSWKSRLRQFSDYFSFSFDKNNKRFGSTRSSPCPGSGGSQSQTQSHASSQGRANNNANGVPDGQEGGTATGKCCNIGKPVSGAGQSLTDPLQRHRAYSLDVPGSGGRYSSNDSSRHPSNNTLQSAAAQDATACDLASGSSSGVLEGPKI